jgi:Transcription elongation factor, GreA/GreB, C-term
MQHHPQQSRHPRQPKSKIIDEADLDRGQVSWLSPIARALMKAHQGDIVDLRAPAGVDQIEVLAIRYGVAADSKACGRSRLFG